MVSLISIPDKQKGIFTYPYYSGDKAIPNITHGQIFEKHFFVANFIQQIVSFCLCCLAKLLWGFDDRLHGVILSLASSGTTRVQPSPVGGISPEDKKALISQIKGINRVYGEIVNESIFEKWLFPALAELNDKTGFAFLGTDRSTIIAQFYYDRDRYEENKMMLIQILTELQGLWI